MLRFRNKQEPGSVSRARSGAARGLERAAAAVDVDEATPRRRRRKPLLLAALAGVGAWLVAKSRRSPEQTEKVADKVASGARRTAASAEKVSAKAAAKAQEAKQPESARTGSNSTR